MFVRECPSGLDIFGDFPGNPKRVEMALVGSCPSLESGNRGRNVFDFLFNSVVEKVLELMVGKHLVPRAVNDVRTV